ncbi:restriction endonuclease subunit S [Escherichia coli]|uniref:restriction endonuclease subunit S n=1 Tax=Escherichia coli TaxID=562 RepID=UPI000BB78FA0|nr:restriction endonuclease subunit S [Escherichia coli]EEV6076766.1 restriction endonuclease subunit S [Escherichia coli]EEY1620998.1 restriction endonuclease subunit S [Escherichia coli]EFH9140474.1 restriction endonuclease subunit S [Escherichia coli]EGI6710346.1 restriction endonuclease subunit S [Escherichia coli]ELY8832828.1 restriction endonuclease subunit S [Escherichia coli]
MVPKGWSSQKLSSVASIIDCKHRTPEYVKSGIPLVSPGTIKWGALDLISPVKRVTEEEYRSLMDHCVVEQGDLVMSRNQSVGVVSYVDSKKPFVLGQDTVLIKAIHADWRFIYYTLQSDLVQRQIAKSAGGSTFSRINLSDIRALNIKTPAICEQDKISQILTAWDKAISVTEKLLTNSQQQKKALMQQLLTGKKRLLDESGVRFNGKWEKKLLSDVADVYQPKTISQSMMSDSGYPVYGANGVIGFYQEFNHETEQIAVTCRGSTCGIVNWTQAKSWITGNAMVINTDNYSYVSKKFLFYTLNGSDLKYLISGSGQPQITGNIKTHIINLPCIEEQQKIATVLSAADAEISTLEKKLACLKDEKKALMQQLLTGKRRVKVDEAVAV